jgi:predicted AAA+ superfamily ATPase
MKVISFIEDDALIKKILKHLGLMVFVGGPRQSGKTTLVKHLCSQAGCAIEERYLNWDAAEDREQIILERFPTAPGLLILDEIHKYTRWRQVVKGLYDKRGHEIPVLVTGSARLDYSRRGGDSLQGAIIFTGCCRSVWRSWASPRRPPWML